MVKYFPSQACAYVLSETDILDHNLFAKYIINSLAHFAHDYMNK